MVKSADETGCVLVSDRVQTVMEALVEVDIDKVVTWS